MVYLHFVCPGSLSPCRGVTLCDGVLWPTPGPVAPLGGDRPAEASEVQTEEPTAPIPAQAAPRAWLMNCLGPLIDLLSAMPIFRNIIGIFQMGPQDFIECEAFIVTKITHPSVVCAR